MDSSSQAYSYFQEARDSRKHSLTFNLNQHFASNTLTGSLVLDYANGKFLTEELKEENIANFSDRQIRLGEMLQTGFRLENRLGDSRYFWSVELAEHLFYESKFHNDIFVLIFKGNKPFENDTASLNPLQIRTMQYATAKMGLRRSGTRFSWHVRAGWVGGQRLLDLKTAKGELYTGEFGRSVSLNLKLRSLEQEKSPESLVDFSGMGLVTDAGVQYTLGANTLIHAGMEGLGFIRWNRNMRERRVDTSAYFEGVEISNILDSFSIAIKDVEELKSSYIKESSGIAESTRLPVYYHLGFSQFFLDKRFQLQGRIGFLDSKLTQMFYGSSVNIYFGRNLLAGVTMDGGGYGGMNLGVQLAWNVADRLFMQAAFHSVNSLVDPKGPFSLKGGLSLGYSWN
ncbi:MAG TPA: DUF5723 family protein [Saprospiraceae bacterium]|nr:DUF5723 family protein [Saprospiraceae bacterium]